MRSSIFMWWWFSVEFFHKNISVSNCCPVLWFYSVICIWNGTAGVRIHRIHFPAAILQIFLFRPRSPGSDQFLMLSAANGIYLNWDIDSLTLWRCWNWWNETKWNWHRSKERRSKKSKHFTHRGNDNSNK